MDERMRIMAVVCHPADAIDHAGGTLCLHAERGDQVVVVVCTHGVDTHDLRRNEALRFEAGAAPADASASLSQKEREVVRGMGILGVTDVRFLRFPDDLVLVTPPLIEAIAAQIADVQPHILILHNPSEEPGIGHAETAQAALQARGLANTSRFRKAGASGSYPMQVFFNEMYGVTTQLTSEGMRYGSVLVDITPVVDKKVRAMDCLTSQYYPGNLARKCIEIVNGRMGLHWSIPYAEAFQPHYPSAYSHLPLNEHLVKIFGARTSENSAAMRIMVTDVPFDPAAGER